MQQTDTSANATLVLKNRERVTLDGVEDVLAFDETTSTCRTTLGDLIIEGSSLRITDFCAEKGDLSVTGKISALAYEDRKEKGGSFARLFGK